MGKGENYESNLIMDIYFGSVHINMTKKDLNLLESAIKAKKNYLTHVKEGLYYERFPQ